MENDGIFYGPWEYFTAIWHMLETFHIFCGHLVNFSSFGMFYQDKSGSPARNKLRASKKLLSLPEKIKMKTFSAKNWRFCFRTLLN
jgi:hypothetical protein